MIDTYGSPERCKEKNYKIWYLKKKRKVFLVNTIKEGHCVVVDKSTFLNESYGLLKFYP